MLSRFKKTDAFNFSEIGAMVLLTGKGHSELVEIEQSLLMQLLKDYTGKNWP